MNESKLQPWYSRLIREVTWLFGFSAWAFILLAIISFDGNDPGWSYQGASRDVSNVIGPLGAFVSDWLLSWFGLGAFAISFLPLLMVRWLVSKTLDGLMWVSRIVGLVILIPGLCIILGLHVGQGHVMLPQGTPGGGMLGSVLVEPLVVQVGPLGSALVGLVGVIFGVTIAFRLHWSDVVEGVGATVLRFGRALSLTPEQKELTPMVKTSFLSRLFAPLNRTSLPTVFRRALIRVAPKPPETDVEQIEAELLGLRADRKYSDPTVDDQKKVTSRHTNVTAFDLMELDGMSGSRIEPIFDDKESLAVLESKAPRNISITPLPEGKSLMDEPELNLIPTGKNSLSKGQKDFGVALPDISLLDPPEPPSDKGFSKDELTEMGDLLIRRLSEFGIEAEIVAINPGPVVTRFEIDPAPGVKVSRITNLAKDLARSLAVISVRVVEVIPGKSTVGIEIPNQHREMVCLYQILSSDAYTKDPSVLTLSLGNDISGQAVCANLAKMPHLLVAGTTGSGKSVGVNVMLLSMLYKASPEDLRLILVDPKMLELSIYDGIPHLLAPVVTDMKDAANALRWCVGEMERRYKVMAALGVRNIDGFNAKIREHENKGESLADPTFVSQGIDLDESPPLLKPIPFIVVVIDEFADMIMIVGKKVDQLIARLAQKARAAGIHLILATQRPSVDVITGLIKANVPTRISFQVSSKIDSRTVLDQGGAEQLLGNGDMLYLPSGKPVPIRIHGAFVDDHEVHKVVNFWKEKGQPDYEETILAGQGSGEGNPQGITLDIDERADPLYDNAVAFVTETRRASISAVQRKLKIGYNRAARMIEAMEVAGVVSEMGNNGAREVLVPPPR